MSHEALLVAAHVQPAAVVTVLLLVLAAAPGASAVGDTVNVQEPVTVTVWPAMVKVPVRGDVPVFAAMENATLPLPLPLAPEVMSSQASLLVAVQAQAAAVVMLLLPVPPGAAGLSAVGDTTNVQGAEPAD